MGVGGVWRAAPTHSPLPRLTGSRKSNRSVSYSGMPIGFTGTMMRNPVRFGSASASFFNRSRRSSSTSFLNVGSRRYFDTLARRVSTSPFQAPVLRRARSSCWTL